MRGRTSSRAWLSLTPEPERELPAVLAAFRAAGARGGAAPDVAREVARAEAIVMRGDERAYLHWLCQAAIWTRGASASDDPAIAHAAAVAREVLHNQAGLLLGLPGGDTRRQAAARILEDA